MKQIIYLDQTQLLDPSLVSIVETLGKIDSTIVNYTVRAGKNVLPFNNSIVRQLDLGMPAFDKNFNRKLTDIIDQQCQLLSQTHSDKPWLVFWSGGIDSTAVLVSILKNISIADRSRIHVACNKISVYENPRFYYDHVVPNFNTIDSTFLSLTEKLLTDYYVITGEFSDQLFFSGKIADPDRDLFQDPDQLLQTVPEQFYQQMITNIQSVDIPVRTYYDFFWWFSFNLMWTGAKVQRAMRSDGPEFMKLFLKNYIGWFEPGVYQQWAMHNSCTGKLELKQYIHEYNHDDYYFTFKTKGNSLGRVGLPGELKWFCMLDDFTKLSLDNDLEQIQELLPTYIN